LRAELTSMHRRGRLLIVCLGLTGSVFVVRAVQIQIIQHKEFAQYARSQQQSAMPLKAKRGGIYDCEGRALAYDMEAKTYTVNPGYMRSPDREARRLASLTGKSTSYWKRKFSQHPGYLVVASRVPQERESAFEKSGIETLRSRTETVRVYPYGELAAEVLGRRGDDEVGLSGLEKQYDNILSGVDGSSIYLRDARGRVVTAWEHTIVQPRDGSDIYLALDIDLWYPGLCHLGQAGAGLSQVPEYRRYERAGVDAQDYSVVDRFPGGTIRTGRHCERRRRQVQYRSPVHTGRPSL
jgi:stage V sporulation protein D (sporulation-specific penicillin-binding protein)